MREVSVWGTMVTFQCFGMIERSHGHPIGPVGCSCIEVAFAVLVGVICEAR